VIRLLSSEWLRFRSRRIVRVLFVVGVIGIVAGATIAGVSSKQPTADQLERGQRAAERNITQCVKRHGFQDAFGPRPQGQSDEDYCRAHIHAEDFVGGDQLDLGDLPQYLQVAAFIAILFGLVVGASMVGASWQTGTITTILSWEPRRVRWFLMRLAVSFVGVLIVALALLAVFAAAIGAAAALRGTTETPPGWLGDVVKTALRIGLVASGASLIGAAVAMIGRNTAAALGGVFIYMAVLESLVRGFRPAMGRFLLGDNIAAFVSGEETQLFQQDSVFTITPVHGAITVALYAAVLVVLAGLFLRQRDVQ
jgi:ABC-2 type transport system permease protein